MASLDVVNYVLSGTVEGNAMLSYGVLLAAFAVLFWVGGRMLVAYLRQRGPRVVTCPETQQPVGVAVDARKIAFTGILHTPEMRLQSCSRWPERGGCAQDCLKQIAAAKDGCLQRKLLGSWYQGRDCAFCGKPIGEIDWTTHHPALLSPQQETVAWEDIPPERVHAMLRTHSPVCWRCHTTYRFVREHPDLITDRSRTV